MVFQLPSWQLLKQGDLPVKLPRWILNCFCTVVGAGLTMALVTVSSPEIGQEPKALAYMMYAFLAAFVVIASHEQEVEGELHSRVTTSIIVFVLATAGGLVSFYTQVFWPWGIGMMFGVVAFLPNGYPPAPESTADETRRRLIRKYLHTLAAVTFVCGAFVQTLMGSVLATVLTLIAGMLSIGLAVSQVGNHKKDHKG